MPRRLVLALSVGLAALLAEPAACDGRVEEGMASWYGGKFQGRPTASGETFDKEEMTAAHRTLPFGTLVRVTNRDTGDEAIVRINDRGPFAKGRVLDCSERAARELGFCGAGTARVRLVTLGRAGGDDGKLSKKERKRLERELERDRGRDGDRRASAPLPPGLVQPVNEDAGQFEVQVGAFREPGNAKRLAERLAAAGHGTRLVVTLEGFTRVRVGPYPSQRAAELAIATIDVEEIPFVVRKD